MSGGASIPDSAREPPLLELARELRAVAQTGLAFAQDRIAFFFSGADATGASSNSYYGEVDLP